MLLVHVHPMLLESATAVWRSSQVFNFISDDMHQPLPGYTCVNGSTVKHDYLWSSTQIRTERGRQQHATAAWSIGLCGRQDSVDRETIIADNTTALHFR